VRKREIYLNCDRKNKQKQKKLIGDFNYYLQIQFFLYYFSSSTIFLLLFLVNFNFSP